MNKFIFLFFALTTSFTSIAQGEESHKQEEHGHEEHDHFHTNEIGISLAPVYFTNNKSYSFGLHSHYVRRLGASRLGVGVGAEYIFNDEQHQTYSAIFQYSPINRLHFIAAPGAAIEKHVEEHEELGEEEGHEEAGHEAVFALHLEATYEFELGPIDIGPSFEFAYDPHDIHLSIGVHIAVPF